MGYGNLSAEVQSALANLNSDDSAYQPQNAHELFKLEQAVQIFFVTIDGHVSTFSAPETLRIFQFTETSEDSSNVFLQVGGWTQPLVPGASPCLQAENGADRGRDGRGREAVEQVGRGRQGGRAHQELGQSGRDCHRCHREGGRPQQAWRNQERWERHGNNSGCCQGRPGGLRHSLQRLGGERQGARQQPEAEQREGGAAQVRQPGWRRVRESLVKKTAKNTGKNIAKNIVGMGSEERKEVTQAEVKQ